MTGYIIEKKSKHSREWTEAAKLNEPKCAARVTGLKEGEEVCF